MTDDQAPRLASRVINAEAELEELHFKLLAHLIRNPQRIDDMQTELLGALQWPGNSLLHTIIAMQKCNALWYLRKFLEYWRVTEEMDALAQAADRPSKPAVEYLAGRVE